MTLTIGADERKRPRMDNDARAKLEAEKNAAEAEVLRLRQEQTALKEAAQLEDSKVGTAERSKIAALVAEARARFDRAKAALRAFDKTGKEHALVAEDDAVLGTIAVLIPPGTSFEAREALIEEALSTPLEDVAAELGVVLAAAPLRFTRERPGRDAEGRTVLDVAGRVEGDRLVPSVSRASRNLRP